MNPTAVSADAHTSGVQHTYERVGSPNMLAHNNAGAHRPHTSVPSNVDTSEQTYDSLESPRPNRPQSYEVPAIRPNPAVPQDIPAEIQLQETAWRQNMNQHATLNEHTQSPVRREYAEPDVHHSYNSPTSN